MSEGYVPSEEEIVSAKDTMSMAQKHATSVREQHRESLSPEQIELGKKISIERYYADSADDGGDGGWGYSGNIGVHSIGLYVPFANTLELNGVKITDKDKIDKFDQKYANLFAVLVEENNIATNTNELLKEEHEEINKVLDELLAL